MFKCDHIKRLTTLISDFIKRLSLYEEQFSRQKHVLLLYYLIFLYLSLLKFYLLNYVCTYYAFLNCTFSSLEIHWQRNSKTNFWRKSSLLLAEQLLVFQHCRLKQELQKIFILNMKKFLFCPFAKTVWPFKI